METRYAVCCVPVSPLRKDPSHITEMVSQQLFGECCIVTDSYPDNWIKVSCKYDGYEGWCQLSHVADIDKDQYELPDNDLTADWVNEVDYNGHHMFVPLGSTLTALKNGHTFWRRSTVKYSGKVWDPTEVKITPKLIKQLSYKFLNSPYLWGGKSVFGIDCSGFTQMVFKLINIPLPRDSYMQVELGDTVMLKQAKCGDLAFFHNAEGRIVHVGILLSDNEIIHSSGKVRLDKMTKEGIVNVETKQRTHDLAVIKRVVSSQYVELTFPDSKQL